MLMLVIIKQECLILKTLHKKFNQKMSKLNKKIKEKFENFFDWIKGAELVELETCNIKKIQSDLN